MTKAGTQKPSMGWLLLSLVVQAAIGASMVPLRYLQAVAQMPGLAVVALADLVAFVIMSWQIIPKIDKRFFQSKALWVMLVIVILRTLLLTFAARFTKAYSVQLINLLAPFFVVILNKLFVKTPLPRFTLLAITVSLIGGALMVFGGLVDQPLAFLLTPEDTLGAVLAFLATFSIAGYMMIVKRGEEIGLPFDAVYISQVSTLTELMGVLSSTAGDNWSAFFHGRLAGNPGLYRNC